MPPLALRSALADLVPLHDDEWARVKTAVTGRRLDPGEAFVREGEVTRQTAFVESGIVRYYALRDGREHVTGFDAEGAMAGDFSCFFRGAPSASTIEAVERCRVWVLTFAAFESLAEYIPALSLARSSIAENLWAGARARAEEAHQLSAEARYRLLTDRSPHVLQRVPLYHIASYLGVTPEALSRIRRRV